MRTEERYKLRCKCEKCERAQVVRISDLVAGGKCQMARLGQPPCGGTLNYYTQDAEDAVGNALSVLAYLNQTVVKKVDPKLAELVDAVNDDAGIWMESSREQTPQQMGWVGQNGLP